MNGYLKHIGKLGLDESTYVFFISDNGPWWKEKTHGGSALPLRSAKTSTWEGGLRVPCVVRAPGRVPKGIECKQLACTMDILPTLTAISGGATPTDRVIDGQNISDLLHGKGNNEAKERTFYYYQHTHLQAVRHGIWKLHLARPAEAPWSPRWASHIAPEDVFEIKNPLLFDLENDIAEQRNVAAVNPEVVEKLLGLAAWAQNDIGDYDLAGENARFFDPQPRRPDAAKWQTSGF